MATSDDSTPQLDDVSFEPIDDGQLFDPPRSAHRPKILLLYGSLRDRSFSRLVNADAALILERGHGLVFARTSRIDDRHHESAD